MGGGMPVGPSPVPSGKSTAIHVRFRIPGGIITRMRFGPQGSGPIGMGTRSSMAPVVEVGQGTIGNTLSQPYGGPDVLQLLGEGCKIVGD